MDWVPIDYGEVFDKRRPFPNQKGMARALEADFPPEKKAENSYDLETTGEIFQKLFGDDIVVLTPKFGKESDLWVRFEKESVWWKEGYFQRFSAKRSAVGYLLRFGKGTVELILRDWMVTWLNQGRRMDG